MKKLIIASAIAMLAVVSQAASVTWGCKKVTLSDGATLATGTAYFMVTSAVAYDKLTGEFDSLASFTAELDKGFNFSATDAGKYNGEEANATLKLSDSTAYTTYLVVFDTATVTKDSKFYLTQTEDMTTYTGDYTAEVAFGSQATSSPTGWNSINIAGPEPVPEPTSGMLVVLGMSLLALKRKKA